MKPLQIYRNIRNKYLYSKRKKYFSELRNLVHPTTTIISSNCFAGRIMQDLNYEYNSPTLGLYFFADDYVKFLSNLNYYLLKATLTFTEFSKYRIGNERREKWPFQYPIGLLDGEIEIHFLHYHSEEEAKAKWQRRANRVNFNDLIVIGMQQNLPSHNAIAEFSKLPYEKKIYFVTEEILQGDDVVYIPEFKGMLEVGDPYKKGHIFYKYLVEKLKHKENLS